LFFFKFFNISAFNVIINVRLAVIILYAKLAKEKIGKYSIKDNASVTRDIMMMANKIKIVLNVVINVSIVPHFLNV
jgi:hypothetical protein